jgi:hypothetical protein
MTSRSAPTREVTPETVRADAVASGESPRHPHLRETHVALRGPSRDDGLVMAFAWVAISASMSASTS